MRGKSGRNGLAGCAGGDDDTSSSGSDWSSSETSISQEVKPKKDEKNALSKNNANSNNNNSMGDKQMELGQRASGHSIADSLDVSLSNRQSSSLAEEFPSEAPISNAARRYVNTKSPIKRTEEKKSDQQQDKKENKGFHHNCKFANFTLKKTPLK